MKSVFWFLLVLVGPRLLLAEQQPVVFLHPLYTGTGAVQDNSVTGLWADGAFTFRIESDGDSGYQVKLDKMRLLTFHLVEIGGARIGDIVTDGDDVLFPTPPMHFLARFTVERDGLHVGWIGSESLRQRLVAGAVRREMVSRPGEAEDTVVVTASAAELRQFVRDCLKRTDALEETVYRQANEEERAADSNQQSWVAVGPHSDSGKYDMALRLAEEAVRLMPGEADYWTTLGAALYRQDRYRESLGALLHAESLRTPAAEEMAIRAMAHFGLGEAKEARMLLEKAREAVKKSDACGNSDAMFLLREAEALIAPKGGEQ